MHTYIKYIMHIYIQYTHTYIYTIHTTYNTYIKYVHTVYTIHNTFIHSYNTYHYGLRYIIQEQNYNRFDQNLIEFLQ